MRTVELHCASADLAEAMAEMRRWVARERCELREFEVAFLPGREVRFRLCFNKAVDAQAFSEAFAASIPEAVAA